VVSVPDYRSKSRGFYFRLYKIFRAVVGLEWCPLSLVKIIEEILERKVAVPV
jgi:hypothetical protein